MANSVDLDDWTAEWAIIASNDFGFTFIDALAFVLFLVEAWNMYRNNADRLDEKMLP